MDDDPDQDALFYIEGPDERGCVWIHSVSPRDPWSQILGPTDKVAEALSQWLGTMNTTIRKWIERQSIRSIHGEAQPTGRLIADRSPHHLVTRLSGA